MANQYIIDVSEYNGSVDWSALKAKGITGGIVKIIKKSLAPDGQFAANQKALEAAGMPWGVYNYSYATTVDKAKTDMKLVCDMLDKVGRKYFKYGVWFDIEDDCQKKLSKDAIADILNAAKETVEARGYTFGIYTGQSFFNEHIDSKKVLCNNWWIARYYNGYNVFTFGQAPDAHYKPTIPQNITAWQFTSSGKAAGTMTSAKCDISLLYRLPVAPAVTAPVKVTIGSARIDERGKVSGGKAGDQTGKEVSTQDWYLHSKGWAVLRPKSTIVADKIALAMEWACANPNIGYDQGNRNSLFVNVASKGYRTDKATACETDCSALVRVCLAYAGIAVRDFNTASEKAVLMATGDFVELPAAQCASADYLRHGDILVTKTKGHTAVVLTNGSKAGAITATEPGKVIDTKMPTIKRGSKGKAVQIWQIICGADPDGSFGPKTEEKTKSWQKVHGLAQDGIVGAKTWRAGLASV